MQAKKNNIISQINKFVLRIDKLPLWILVVGLFAIVFAPFLVLKEGSVFEIHDQLDEYMMNNVLTARHLFEGVNELPEMMGGINASGLQPAAILFVPLYIILPEFWAFVLQYAIVFLIGFLGMYFCVKELTGSSILSVTAAACFCMLPMYPIYGLSQMGIPLVMYGFLRLLHCKKPWISLGIMILYGLTSHLVYTGYVVLSLWAVAIIVLFLRKKLNKWFVVAFTILLVTYIFVNYGLFVEVIWGQAGYVSHREEMIAGALPFWNAVKTMFVDSGQHSPSLHKYLIVPILFLLLVEGIGWKRLTESEKTKYLVALAGLMFLACIALFYGFCKSEIVANWKNSITGILRYFQMERYYWLYPAGWYIEFAYVFSIWWKRENTENIKRFWRWPSFKLAILVLMLLPTLQLIKVNSIFYMNVNQMNNGSGVTGYITWENYYAENLMEKIENVIGKDTSTYRIAHLGISPCPSLMHGFYTVDGYSNNYSLEYKHMFRRVISKELEKNEEMRVYFDKWGNRCYLMNHVTGYYYMLAKGNDVQLQNVEFDMEALKELGCEYIFSGAEIIDAEDMGLEFMGYYETEESYWGIWLYALNN